MRLRLELATELLIRWNSNSGSRTSSVAACRSPTIVVEHPDFHYNCCCYSATRVLSHYPQEEKNTVKKLLSMTFALALMSSMSFAQASGSSGSSGTTASGQTSTDQSTTTTTTKTTKKHHRRHKKSASGDTTANPNGASSTTPK